MSTKYKKEFTFRARYGVSSNSTFYDLFDNMKSMM